jgi:hypothetical protein
VVRAEAGRVSLSAFKGGDRVELTAKSGKALNRFFPAVVDRRRGHVRRHPFGR